METKHKESIFSAVNLPQTCNATPVSLMFKGFPHPFYEHFVLTTLALSPVCYSGRGCRGKALLLLLVTAVSALVLSRAYEVISVAFSNHPSRDVRASFRLF